MRPRLLVLLVQEGGHLPPGTVVTISFAICLFPKSPPCSGQLRVLCKVRINIPPTLTKYTIHFSKQGMDGD